MQKYIKLFALILILMEFNLYHNRAYALTGTSSSNGPIVSVQFAVRNVLSDDNIPVVNATPSRVSLVQFPAEIAQCNGASRFIKIKYADATATSGSIQSGSTSTPSSQQSQTESNVSGNPVSSVFISVELQDGAQGSQGAVSTTFEQLKDTPATWFLCRMKREKSDTFCTAYNDSEPYCWVSFAVRIVDPEYTNGIVILEKPNGTNDLISPEQLSGIPFVHTFVDKKNRLHHDNKEGIKNKPSSFHPEPKKMIPSVIVENKNLNNSNITAREKKANENRSNELNSNKMKNSNDENQLELIQNLKLVQNNIPEKKEAKKLTKNESKEDLVDPVFFSEIIEK